MQWWISKLHENVALGAHVQLNVAFPVQGGGAGRCTLDDALVGARRILPLDYSTIHLPPIVGVSMREIPKDTEFAVLALNSPIVSALKEMEGIPPSMQSNVQVRLVACQCGAYHVSLTSMTDLCCGDTLVPANSCSPRVIVQFDGSAHRNRRIGGAGAALLQVESNGISLLDWGARSLPNCADNIVAETHGAALAITLYDKYRSLCQEQELTPLPLDRIQGDIKPLLQHLDFRGRFRRRDLVSLIHQFQAKRSRIAPDAITEYRPREANALADFFAGQASSYLTEEGAASGQVTAPIDISIDPPYDLLLATNAVIPGPHHSGKTVLVLQETLGCDMPQMAKYAGWMDGKCAKSVRAIALATRLGNCAMCVEYVSAATDGRGRLYARQISAQTLPRELRLLAYGATHKEVDMSGAHYELIRAMCASESLPPVRTLRQKLRLAWGLERTTDGEGQLHRAVKLFPMRVINCGATQALAVVRPWLEVEYRNRHFYATEAMEGIVMQLFLLEVRKRCFAPSIIWLHDGFWIGKEVDDEVLRAAEKYVRSRLFPQSENSEPLFRIVDLTEARDAVLHSQSFSPIGPIFPASRWEENISRRSPKGLTRQFPVAKFVHKVGSKRKFPTYFHRVGKRARLFRLRM